MRLDCYASERQYLGHLLPVWRALPAAVRGTFTLGRLIRSRYPDALPDDPDVAWGPAPVRSDAVLVASYGDERACGGAPVILMEHGAGQSYGNTHPAYAGGHDRWRVILFLNPSQRVADRNAALYPHTASIAVGCPLLDEWLPDPPPPTRPDSVALAWHWNLSLWPEGRTALPHYQQVLGELARAFPLLGHGHPRAMPHLRPIYTRAGIPIVEDLHSVMEQAGTLVCDNSSAIWIMAALDRPVVLLNAPWYNRSAQHGLRFWDEASVGYQVGHPSELAKVIRWAQADPPEVADARRASAERVFGPLDGQASARAAAAVVEVLTGFDPEKWRGEWKSHVRPRPQRRGR